MEANIRLKIYFLKIYLNIISNFKKITSGNGQIIVVFTFIQQASFFWASYIIMLPVKLNFILSKYG